MPTPRSAPPAFGVKGRHFASRKAPRRCARGPRRRWRRPGSTGSTKGTHLAGRRGGVKTARRGAESPAALPARPSGPNGSCRATTGPWAARKRIRKGVAVPHAALAPTGLGGPGRCKNCFRLPEGKMLAERLDQIDEELLRQVCADAWGETATLDFKQVLPGNSAEEKLELCKDVAAMANAEGGDIVFGISEKSGVADAVISITGEPADRAKRRLGQALDAGIEPRISGLNLQEIPTAAGYCLLIRVPASFEGPHRIKDNRFVMRTGSHTVDLSYDQLRNAFGRTATLVDRARQFIADRRTMIQNNEKNSLGDQPICIAHLVPLAGVAGRLRPAVHALQADYADFRFDDWGGASSFLNLDGVLAHPGGDMAQIAYTQAFRDGSFEAIRPGASQIRENYIPSRTVTTFFRDALYKFASAAAKHGATGPAIFSSALINVTGYTFGVDQIYNLQHRAEADRPNLLLPEVWIERIEDLKNVDALVRYPMDVLWQSFGVSHCKEYDAEGRWSPRIG